MFSNNSEHQGSTWREDLRQECIEEEKIDEVWWCKISFMECIELEKIDRELLQIKK